MSHTDKTDPFWVNMATGYYKSKPVHSHEDGRECDLKPISDWARSDGWWFSTGQCHWAFVYDGRNVCCCWMCHGWAGQYGATSARQSRHRAKVDVHRWTAEFNGSGDIQEW